MSPNLLSAARSPAPFRASGREIAGVTLPIAVSALAAGGWFELAFLHLHHSGAALLGMFAASLCFAACFAGITALGVVWENEAVRLTQLRRQLARCSLASVVLVLFLPEYLARVQPVPLRSNLLLLITALLWVALCTVCIRERRGFQWSARSTKITAIVGLTLLFIAVTLLAIRKYQTFGYVGQDLAYFGQIMYTTLHGHLFWGNLLQDLLYSRPVATDFAGHNSPIMFLLLPFYALAPSPITLLVLRNLILLGCAVPVYLLARRRVAVPIAYLWVVAFLFTPAILTQSTFDFYPLTFAALPLLFTIYFYLEQRYTAVCVALGLTLLIREDLIFFAFGLGMVALFHRRTIRWTLVPLMAAVAWGVISFFVVLPAALHGATFVTDACFSHLGSGYGEMLRNVLHHPRANVLVHGNIVYLKTLFSATGLILSFGNPVMLLCLPYLAINLLAGAGRCITTVISAQYSVVPATLLFASALLTITQRSRSSRLSHLAKLGLHSDAAPPLLLVALSCASLLFVTGKPQIDEFRRQPWSHEANLVLSIIPKHAGVAAPRYMLPHLANRDCLYQTQRLPEYHSPVYEYLILDTDWDHINASEIYRDQYASLERDAAADPTLRRIYASTQYIVYWNPARHGQSCTPGLSPTGASLQAASIHP